MQPNPHHKSISVLKISTSYPRNEGDWQGVFIRKIVESLSSHTKSIDLSLWAPEGPVPRKVKQLTSSKDKIWLRNLSEKGGIAHQLRNTPFHGIISALILLIKLRGVYVKGQGIDIYHINWLQNAIPLIGLKRKAVITVLGTDLKLLRLPMMKSLIRMVLRSNTCILSPNAAWMIPELEEAFGDVAEITATNFGVDPSWYEVENIPPSPTEIWIAVNRVTKDKIGQLFKWGEKIFNSPNRQFHLIGPNQESLEIPGWVNYHGPASTEELLSKWYPKATGFLTLSEHSEGKPQILLETLAAGIPVIASDIQAHNEAIEHKKNGYIVSSSEAFERAVLDISKKECRKHLSKACRSTAADLYGTWNDCAGRYISLYEALLKK